MTWVEASVSGGSDTGQWVESNLDQWNLGVPYTPVSLVGLGALYGVGTGVSTVWANSDKVFFGTFDDGVKYIYKTDIVVDVDNPITLSGAAHNYYEQSLTSKSIRYIHGNNNFLMVCTVAGVDVIRMGSNGYRSSNSTTVARKCFMTSTGKFYYTTADTGGWALNMVNSSLCDWDLPDYSWVTGSGVLAAGLAINDIFVTEGTAYDGIQNTIFLATSSGVYVLDESILDYDIYYITTVSGS